MADKLLIAGLSGALFCTGSLPGWLLGLVVSRDCIIVGCAFYYRYRTRPPGVRFFDTRHKQSYTVEPTRISKVNTGAQILLLVATLSQGAWGSPGATPLLGLTYFVATTTCWSGVDYAVKFGQLVWGKEHSGSVFKIRQKREEASSPDDSRGLPSKRGHEP